MSRKDEILSDNRISAEEQLELERMDAQQPAPESKQPEVEEWTEEDEQLLAMLEEKEAEEARENFEGEETEWSTPLINPETQQISSQGLGEKAAVFGAGVVQGTTGWLDEILAAPHALYDSLSDGNISFSEVATRYRKHKADYEKSIKKMEHENPFLYNVGSITGNVAASAATIGVPGTWAAFGANSLKSALALGSFRGLGQSDMVNEDLWDTAGTVVQEVLLEGGTYGLGRGIGRLVGKGSGKINEASDILREDARIAAQGGAELGGSKLVNVQKNNSLFSLLGMHGTSGKVEEFEEFVLRRRNMSPEQYIADIEKDLPLMEAKNPFELLDALRNKKTEYWEKIEGMFKQVDEKLPEGVIDPHQLKKQMLAEVQASNEFLGMTAKQEAAALNKLAPQLDAIISEGKLLTLVDAQDVLNTVNGRKGLNEGVRHALDRVVRSNMHSSVENYLGKEGLGEFKELKRHWGNLHETEGFLQKARSRHQRELSQFDSSIRTLGTELGDYTRLAVKDASMLNKAGQVFVNFVKSKRPDAYLPLERYQQLQHLSNRVSENPVRYNKLVQDVLMGARRGSEDFVEALGTLQASVNLDEQPIKRTTEDLQARGADLVNVMRRVDPNLSSALEDALANQDMKKAASIVGLAGTLPEAEGLIEAGLGFDGQISTDIEFQEAMKLIDKANISHTQKLLLREQAKPENGGKVPQIQEEANYKEFKKAHKINKRRNRNKNGKKGTDF